MTMTSLVEDIGARLQELGIVDGASGFRLCRGHRPDTPDAIVVLTQYAGSPSAYSRAAAIERPGLQVMVRSGTRAGAEAKAYAIADALDDERNPTFSVGETRYMRCERAASPSPLEIDHSGRHVWVVNFICWR